MFKNVVIGFFSLALLMSPASTAAIISSFDADAKLTISADFEIIDFETFLDDEFLEEIGAGAGSVSGSGDDLFDLSIGDATLSAYADGAVTGSPGSVDAFYLSSGEFYLENTGTTDFVGTLTFDLELIASIFTDTLDEAALAFSSIVIGYEHADDNGDLIDDDVIVDEAIEFDSSLDGVGDFSDTIAYGTTSTFTLGADESIYYYFELDAAGYADTARTASVPVSEPSILLIFVLGVFGLAFNRLKRKHK